MSLYLGNQKVTPTVVYKDNKKLIQVVSGAVGDLTAEDLKGLTSIREQAFYRYVSLKGITIPGSVTRIGWAAFSGCSGLTSITIPDSVRGMGHNVFQNCSNLTSVIIGNGVTSTGDSAFENCSSLTSVTIGSSVTSIGNYAFDGCSSLTSVNMLSTTPPTIKSETFPSGFSGTITVPAGTGDAYKAATNWSKYADKIQEAAA